MDGRGHPTISDWRESGFHFSDHPGKLVITGFGEMDFVPDPAGMALNAIARLIIKRGVDRQGSWWKFIRFSVTQVIFIPPGEILDPTSMQSADGSHFL